MKYSTRQVLVLTLIFFTCAKGKMEGFVVGGDFTTVSQYPHSAFLDARCKEAGHWICGSAILNQKILLTAAHCVDGCDWKNNENSRLIALIGNEDLREVSIKRKILDVRMHKDFDDKTMENDIAVAIVRREIPLSEDVKRVIITEEYPEGIKFGFVAGWGILKDDSDETSLILKHVRQKLRSPETCALIGYLHPGMYCAGSTEKDSDHPARGDSGSAMVTIRGYHQIGLVSFCIRRFPALMVYTNVSYYYGWIVANARDVYCDNQDYGMDVKME